MPKRIVTIETRLKNNTDLTNYLNEAVIEYERVKRKIWHEMTDPNFKKNYPKESMFTKHCRAIYGLHSRTINSIIHEVKGEMNAYIALKKTELLQVTNKIYSQQKRINKSIAIIEELKPKVTNNTTTFKELWTYRRYKTKLYYQKNKLNKLNNIKQKLEYIIENNIYNICFGTKKLFDKQHRLEENNYKTHTKWHNDFVKNRDKNIYFLGSANETMGNQMIYLLYDNYSESFYIKVRKIAKTDEKRCSPDNYVSYVGLTFKHREEDVIELLINQIHNTESAKPINYRFHKEGTKWYLQIIFTADFSNSRYITRSSYGVVGLDYNNRFIQMAETNDTGNLIKLQTINLKYHGTGNKAETEIEQKIAEIVKYAASVGKDIAIENLDFKKTKAEQLKATSNRGKEYNSMLHLFDYNRYKQTLVNIAFNNQVFLDLVNPKDTTKIAKQKYRKQMKLTSHQGAAFVIARRCQGYVDKLKPKTHKITKKKVA